MKIISQELRTAREIFGQCTYARSYIDQLIMKVTKLELAGKEIGFTLCGASLRAYQKVLFKKEETAYIALMVLENHDDHILEAQIFATQTLLAAQLEPQLEPLTLVDDTDQSKTCGGIPI